MTKPKTSTDSKTGDEPAKIAAEIRWLKTQRTIAILAAVGGAIAFLVTNMTQISVLWSGKPRVYVISADDFVRRTGRFDISNRSGKDQGVAVGDSFPSSPKWFALEAGAYHFAAKVQNEVVYEQDFTIQNGEQIGLVVPSMSDGNIRLIVKNWGAHVAPASELDLAVEASGNGYLWVFEKGHGGYVPIYPENCPSKCENDIRAEDKYLFPDKKHRVLFAGDRPGSETLLFIVTSSEQLSAAQQIALRFDSAIPKASSGNRMPNWGYAQISYVID